MIQNRVTVLALLLSISSQAKAEFNVQFYGGNGVTLNHDATVNLPDAGLSGTHKDLRFDRTTIIGGRAIYWTERFKYVGFGLDASHFHGPDQKTQIAETDLCVTGVECYESAEKIKKFNNKITAVGVELMLRYPLLKSAQFPKGQLQPYLGVGPSVFVTTLKDTDNFIPAGQSSTYTSVGVMASAGAMLFLTEHIGAFIEYRDSNFEVKDTFYNNRVVNNITLGKTLGQATFNIQAVLGGITFSF